MKDSHYATALCCLDISGTTRDRKLKFYTHFDGAKYSFRYENFSARGCAGGGRIAPSVNLGRPHISETTKARKSKF